ncbi:MAG TPA: RNA polymerase sigma factor [Gemmatimonadales bacterium]|jgi:RNA polymerase sigma-70 factor (ECF subfamily)|nr:RNA polymerase sigma factor [Gemmatimonadales bacterium]
MQPPDLERELDRVHIAAFGWALACCAGDRSRAEDALQSSYLKIVDGRARFDGRSSFRTWLFGIVRRTAAEARRRERWGRWLPLVGFSASLGDGRPDSAAALIRSEESRRLELALGKLPARQREALHLVFYQDMTIAQAAEVLGVSLGTARTHYQRGKAGLRRMLEETEGK